MFVQFLFAKSVVWDIWDIRTATVEFQTQKTCV
jgi:hypothetical protein